MAAPQIYRAMTLAELALRITERPEHARRRRIILEFIEEYRHEPIEVRPKLLSERPASTGSRRYDAFLGALAEHLAYHDELPVPSWTYEDDRFLEQWWFPIDLPSVRADALVHGPAAFRIRGIFLGTGALDRA
ncbi:MAG: hypothetical protein ACRD0B_01175 [Acidimicrobiales bacterium]